MTFLTANPTLVPTFVLLGSFLVPASFVAWAFERRLAGEITATLVSKTFVLGRVLGNNARTGNEHQAPGVDTQPPPQREGEQGGQHHAHHSAESVLAGLGDGRLHDEDRGQRGQDPPGHSGHLAAHGPSDPRRAWERVFETLIGALVGVLVNVLISPPVHVHEARDSLADMARKCRAAGADRAAALRRRGVPTQARTKELLWSARDFFPEARPQSRSERTSGPVQAGTEAVNHIADQSSGVVKLRVDGPRAGLVRDG